MKQRVCIGVVVLLYMLTGLFWAATIYFVLKGAR